MPPEIKWAEITIGKTIRRYTAGVDATEMGIVGPTAFAVELVDGSVKTFLNCPTVIYQEDDDDVPKIITADSRLEVAS